MRVFLRRTVWLFVGKLFRQAVILSVCASACLLFCLCSVSAHLELKENDTIIILDRRSVRDLTPDPTRFNLQFLWNIFLFLTDDSLCEFLLSCLYLQIKQRSFCTQANSFWQISLVISPFFFLFLSESLDELAGKRVMLFSYGSGLASAMFSFRISDDFGPSSPLNTLVTSLKDIPARLASRKEVEPAEFLETLKIREHTHNNSSYTPIGSEEDLFPGTYYLTYVDDKFRRTYQRKKNSSNEGSCMVV